MPSKRRCPTCGSRQWHKEPASGLIACSEGHVLQNYRNESMDAEELGPYALKKRALKSGKKKRERESRANPELYHGARGRYLYFECLQYLLQKQTVTLAHEWKLPPEFETICRDTWALHLSLLPDPPPAEQAFAEEVTGTENVSKEKSDSEDQKIEKPTEESRSTKQDDLSDDEMADESDAEDSELEALLRENSELEESSEEEEEEDKQRVPEGNKRSRKGRRHGRSVYESPASTIAVLVVACWTLRVPVLCRDFTRHAVALRLEFRSTEHIMDRLIERYELPYLDPVARQLLPASMVTHLSKHNIQALSPHHAPSARLIYGLGSRLARLMYNRYGVYTPAANAAPILWRTVSQGLCGTPVLYQMTKRLGRVLSLPLALDRSLTPKGKKVKRYDPDGHAYENVAPEVALMSTGIIVLKMVYGLDGRSRVPREADDAACALPEAKQYLASLKAVEDEEDMRDSRGVFDGSHDDVRIEELGEEEMDGYLGFAKHALVGERTGDELLERYFPLAAEDRGTMRAELKTHGVGLRGVMADESGTELRPGEGYRKYRAADVGGTVCVAYDVVLGRAARWLGVGSEYLGGVIEAYEGRIKIGGGV